MQHWGIPLSRRFRALKLWFVIRTYGVAGLQAYIREHCRLAKVFESCVKVDDRFEVKGHVTLGLVSFKLKAGNVATQMLLRAINMSGKLHMVPAVINDDYVIRFAVCSVNASDDDILYAWNIIKDMTSKLSNQSASFDVYRSDQHVSESEEEDDTTEKVVELTHSPRLSTTSPAQNGTVDDVFLFDNNIPSIATRIPASAESADTLALRRRNRILRLLSEPQRSVSVQLDDRRCEHYSSTDMSMGLSSSWVNGGLPEHHMPSNGLNVDGEDDTQVDERGQSQPGGQRSHNRLLLSHGRCGARRKNTRSVDACCSGSSDAVTMKRRGTLVAGKMVAIDDDHCTNDDDDDDDDAHLCNGMDDQLTNKSCTPDCSNAAI